MREVTFVAGPSAKSECYVSILSGSGGGVEANINRWRNQMGLAALTAAELADLPTLDVLGQQALFIQILGNYTGMAGPTMENYLMLGVVCPLEAEAVFIKMVGPAAEVEPETERFIGFCQSLELDSQ